MIRTPAVPNAEASGLANVSPEARALFRPGMTRRKYVLCLVDAGLIDDATVFFGSLVPCHAVWWACLCVWKLLGSRLSPVQRDHLRAAVKWATEPSEKHRREAGALCAQVNESDPICWVLIAATRAGSSVSPDVPLSVIDGKAVSKAAETAVRKAVATLPEAERSTALKHAIRLGFDIAAGGCPRMVLPGTNS